jgi:beta-galactosidase
MTYAARILLLHLLIAASTLAADGAIWIEGEKPIGGVTAPWTVAPVDHPEYLSGDAWLQAMVPETELEKTIPADGLVVGWAFTVANAGRHEIWERYGFESIRSPWDWRVDGGAWTTVPALTQPYTDLMDPGFWCEVAWTRLGEADLQAGEHRIELRLNRQYDDKKQPQRSLHVVDCFCISPVPFHPHGRHRPGADWMTDADRAAAAASFALPAPVGDERSSVPLAGTWEIARFDEFEPADRGAPDCQLPDAKDCEWSAIAVPGAKNALRPDLDLAHRVIYRTRLAVPAAHAGRSFILHFPAINMLASVLVNGRFCGSTQAMLTDWDCDVTAALKPGELNELCVVIKDTHYALSPELAGKRWSALALTPASWTTTGFITAVMDYPVATSPECGLLETPILIAAGAVYASDVFAKPSVANHELALEVTLRNPGAAAAKARIEVAIEPFAGGKAEKTFAAKEIELAPGVEQVVNFAEGWDNPRLWWPDQPDQYRAVTRVCVDGRPVDVRRTAFGFREWGWSSDQFTLNGIPWHFHADITAPSDTDFDANLAVLREHSQNMVRMWRWRWWGRPQQDALDWFDAHGMAVRHTGIFDGEGANYGHRIGNRKLFDHWIEQLKAWTRAERNHPSLLIWSIENEVTFINSRNLGMMQIVEPMIAEGARAVMALDPTRPVMVDGGRCLQKEDLPVNGCHYDETDWREYPEEAYTYALAMKSHQQPWNIWSVSPWRMVPDRPIFHGEAYYLNGNRPGDLAQWGGEEAFTGWIGARVGAGRFAKILSEGYRWHGVAAFHFWLWQDEVAPYYNSWKPVITLVREWNWTFASGATVTRRIKTLNDTRFADPIDLDWQVTLGGKRVASATKRYQVAPGSALEDVLSFALPEVAERTAGELTLSCRRGGQEIFHDVKPLVAIPASGPKPTFKSGELAVFDPKGSVSARLKQRRIDYTLFTDPQAIPDSARVVVVGADALDPVAATGSQWLAVAARGGRVLVLDQAHPLQAAVIPSDAAPTAFTGRVAFIENLQHPAFAGLDQPDFFTWSGDEVVYRNVYSKPTRGAVSLAHCDQALRYSALAESRVNDGLMVLCQLAVGSRLADEPVAQRLFDNLLAYCADYQPLRKSTAVVFDEASPRGKVLAESGLVYAKASDPLAAVRAGKAEIVVFDATPSNLKALAGDPKAVHAFTGKGGWLFAWGLTPDGLAEFNRLVGVEHLIRPFRRERVMLPVARDPILSGLSMSDVTLDSGQQIAFWSGQRYAASDSFSYVVDYDDLAPFIRYPDWSQFNPGAKEPAPDHDPLNLVNGFVNADDWRYIFQIAATPSFTEWDMTLPRPERPTQLDIVDNGNYSLLTRLEFVYDGDVAHPVAIPLQPVKDMLQSITLPDRSVTRIHVKLAEWQKSQAPAVVGIDNWWIRVARSPAFYEQVKPLLNIGALMKYPQGRGGIILCELNVPEAEQNPENGPKRRALVSTLLRNIGAVFSARHTLVAGANLDYAPVPLDEACNQFLTRERGWFDDEPADLAGFPVGENRFAGVAYRVRDVRTSPLPAAISLAGPHLKAVLPARVEGIPVNRRADALFFLHTFKQTKAWQAPGDGPRTPPTLWRYVVHYSDGETAMVPVRLGEGAAGWLQPQPTGLAGAVVAWTGPADPAAPAHAVVYQMQWTNPRPDADIARLDIAYDDHDQNAYGVPVVLAVTAASERAPVAK